MNTTNHNFNDTELINQLLSALKQYFENDVDVTHSCFVAYSGGMDSSVLLYLLAHLKKTLPFSLTAIHVHHGLSSHADFWSQHCQKVCDRLNVPLIIQHVTLEHSLSLGLEAEARNKRWQVFDEQVEEHGLLFLAHHQDDQVETLLLNLLRGTGVKGASGIESRYKKENYHVVRPWLSFSKQQLLHAATQLQCEWIEDESNNNDNLRRNFLRHHIFPVIKTQWPEYRKNLSQFCDHMKETQSLLNDIAKQDFEKLSITHQCQIPLLNTLNFARRKNVLRYWASQQAYYLPNSDHFDELLKQLKDFRQDGAIDFRWGDWCFKQSRETLYLCTLDELNIEKKEIAWRDISLSLTWNNTVQIQSVKKQGKGIRPPLENEIVTVKTRIGGETCHPHYRKVSTSLKKVLQESSLPPWQREQLPLIFYNDELVCAVELFYEKSFCVTEQEEGLIFKKSESA